MTFLNSKIAVAENHGTFSGPGVLPAAEVLTGTITSTGKRVIGIGTKFKSEVQIGSFLYSNGEVREVKDWVSDTEVLLTKAFSNNISSLNISSATNASPIVITTTTDHNIVTGETVVISGVLGNTAANGTFKVKKLSSTTLSLDESTGNGTYTSGGTVRKSVMMCRPGIYRFIGIDNTGASSGTITGKTWPTGKIFNIEDNAGLSPLPFDATGTTFLIVTKE